MTCFLSSVNFAKVIYTPGTRHYYEQPRRKSSIVATQFTPTASSDWSTTDRSIVEPGGRSGQCCFSRNNVDNCRNRGMITGNPDIFNDIFLSNCEISMREQKLKFCRNVDVFHLDLSPHRSKNPIFKYMVPDLRSKVKVKTISIWNCCYYSNA